MPKINAFLKMGNSGLSLFILVFSNNMFYRRNFSVIRTWIVGAEEKHADN